MTINTDERIEALLNRRGESFASVEQANQCLHECMGLIVTLYIERNTLRDHLKEVKQWMTEGEDLSVAGEKSTLFRLGVWWAERPWRRWVEV